MTSSPSPSSDRGSGAASVLRVRRVGGVCQPRLPLPHVPVQALGQALKPVVHQVVAADGGYWVARRSDLDAVKKKKKNKAGRQQI